MSWRDRLHGWWVRTSERLREGYEAQLLDDVLHEQGEVNKILAPSEREHGLPVPREIRPRPLPLGWLLKPEVLQFTLPCLAVTVLIELVNGLSSMWEQSVVGAVIITGIWLFVKGWFLTTMGRWIFSSRWERLHEECYARWQWRAVAAAQSETLLAPAREPDAEGDAAPRLPA